MYKLAFFVPVEHAEAVKEAVFQTGAGVIGHYRKCCFQTTGTGQFQPTAEAQPHTGRPGELTYVDEARVEIHCGDEVITSAIAALKLAHPYEEVAYDVSELVDL